MCFSLKICNTGAHKCKCLNREIIGFRYRKPRFGFQLSHTQADDLGLQVFRLHFLSFSAYKMQDSIIDVNGIYSIT